MLDAPVPPTASGILKFHTVDHSSGLPTVFRRKNGQVALEDVRDICGQQILPLRSHGFDKSPYEAEVATTMAATFETRPMHGRLAGAEIGHGELAHVADDLTVREMQTGQSLANQGGVCDHRKGGGCARCILEVDDLIVTNVVVTLVHALAVRPGEERVCHVLDIWDLVDEGSDGPADVTQGNSVQINLLGAVRTLRFVCAVQTTRCIAGFCGLLRLAEMLQSTKR